MLATSHVARENAMPLSSLERRVLEHLDLPHMLRFLSELVSIPSVGGAETPAQERVARWMKEEGLEVDVWPLDLPTLKAHPAYSAEVEREEGLGVVGVLGEDRGGRSLILNGHVDVVPPGDLNDWDLSPWSGRIRDGRLHGRGALDMKGGLACGLYAARAIRDAGVRLKGPLILESVVGEEDGGVGTLAAILRGYRARGAVIMEPTGLSICPAQAGCLNFRLSVRGRAAHGAIRDMGVSALEKFRPVFDALLALETKRNHTCEDPLFQGYRTPFSLSVGTIRGGEWASTVPDRVTVEGRYGTRPEEDPAAARKELEAAVEEASRNDPWLREHPPELEWWGGTFLPARVPHDHPVVRSLQGAFRDAVGPEAALQGVTYGSDMRLLVREAETPTVLFGPGHVRDAHGVNESVTVVELESTLRSLTLMALRFCGTEDD
jgi:acetylornithine deacetylase